MKSFKKTYKYISALTLVLFLSSFILPAGMSAASLFCNMDMMPMNRGVHSCCDLHETGQHEDATILSDKETCTYQEVCPHILSKKQADVQAIPQLFKEFSAAFVYKDIPRGFADLKLSKSFRLTSFVPNSTPPLFLLNSVFLN